MDEEIPANTGDNGKCVNPIPLGSLYFGFSLGLWSGERIGESNIIAIAVLFSIISGVCFISVFVKPVLKWFSKLQKGLVFLTFVVSLSFFATDLLQAFLQTTQSIQIWIACFGFAWVVVFLLSMIKDSVKQQSAQTNNRIIKLFRNIQPYVPYVIMLAFLVIAGTKFYKHEFWSTEFYSGVYLVAIALLSLLVYKGWLPVHGGLFEYTD